MKVFRVLLAFFCVAFAAFDLRAAEPANRELVYVDDQHVIRWRADQREVALFGANYCLPSSSDYRAAGYLGVDRKKLIEQDMAHFARMGWDGMRLALWGDWENCDREGNLVANEHLDLLDYLLFRAKERGIFMLFTPIHRHTALWPDGKDSDAIQGFSKHYPASELGRNPAAIRAQQNYLRQILDHVNPYTGVAIKDEPSILFIEMINEPHHHAADFDGSVAYINALADAVRSTGCQKLLFHNLSQDFRMARAITASRVQGYSFGWYPTNLVAGRTLTENYLRWVDRYTPLMGADAPRLPSIVYEFDSADMLASYMYPAMVRGFRRVGAQFAAMFAYDMLATAPFNLGWQTHYLNLVYSPRKAVSAIVAAEAMRTLPRGGDYGDYPHNRRFQSFRVDYEADLSELVKDDVFMHSNDTDSAPPAPARLRRVIGVGRSPVVHYDGTGSYFLDRIADGVWRLELYPDALVTQDPFAQRLNYREVSIRLMSREWPMKIDLPDLGVNFAVKPLNEGNTHAPDVAQATFSIRPGVYLLTAHGARAARLPARLDQIGLREFVCPPDHDLTPNVISHVRAEFPAGLPLRFDFDAIGAKAPRHLELNYRHAGSAEWRKTAAILVRGYRYRAEIPAAEATPGTIEYFVTGEFDEKHRFPAIEVWSARIVAAQEPLTLFAGEGDARRVFAMRVSGDRPGGFFQAVPTEGESPAAIRLLAPARDRAVHHAVSLPIKARIASREETIRRAKNLRIKAAGAGGFRLTLVEADGTAWSSDISVRSEWSEIDIPIGALRAGEALKLPLGYPGNWNFELPPPGGRNGLDASPELTRVEHLQFKALPAGPEIAEPSSVRIASVEVRFD